MNDLYGNNLARVYDSIYQGFIDYKEEYRYYSRICKKYGARSIAEIACGSGNLAKLFATSFEDYLGLDFSEHMLRLAREKYPAGNFLKCDMRDVELTKKYQAALITGRSTSYLLSEVDLEQTFSSAHRFLEVPGIFVFDCIDAHTFMPYIAKNPEVTHRTIVDQVLYSRDTKWFPKIGGNGNLVHWESKYFQEKDEKRKELGSDVTTFRVFEREEIQKILKRNGFFILNIADRKTYAFDTFVVTAQKEK